MTSAGLASRMAEVAAATERELVGIFALQEAAAPPELLAAMRYATLEAGKRLRPFLVHAAGELCGAEPAACRRVGAALELVHCYSLVHDDLPAMDDALLRRGKPACHRKFGEAVAILAGDALVALAFEALAREDWRCEPDVKARLLVGLGRASGAAGMCGGQVLDLASSEERPGERALVRLQQLKTGALIRFALEAGCVLGGADQATLAAIGLYADRLGLAFQIQDDLLDAAGSEAETGKDAGRDRSLGRTTFVTLLGAGAARTRLGVLREEGVRALDRLGDGGSVLVDLFDFVISRRS